MSAQARLVAAQQPLVGVHELDGLPRCTGAEDGELGLAPFWPRKVSRVGQLFEDLAAARRRLEREGRG